MAAYVDFVYYSDTYFGTAVLLTEFDKLALQASAQIDQLTFDRAAPIMEEITTPDLALQDKIRMAVCAVIDEIKTWTSIGEFGRIKSESVGQHSVTYMDDSTTFGKSTRSAARVYLGNTGLMYAGLDVATSVE